MTEEQGAAPSEAAVEEVVNEGLPVEATAEAEAPQAEPEQDAEEKERSKSAERRARRREAEQRDKQALADARAEVERLRARLEADKKPDAKDYSDPDQYLADLAGWGAAQRIARDRVEEASHQARQIETAGRRQQIEAFEASAQELAATYPDFQAARQVAANPAIVSQPLSEMVLESDVAAHLAYHLGKNPTEAIRLSGLGPLAMAREIAALESRFLAPAPKTVSSAPAPIRPVTPAGTAMKDPDSMTNEEYRAARKAGIIR